MYKTMSLEVSLERLLNSIIGNEIGLEKPSEFALVIYGLQSLVLSLESLYSFNKASQGTTNVCKVSLSYIIPWSP